MDVLFLTKYDRKGASSRYRSLQYFPYFENAGIHCRYEPLLSNEYLEMLYDVGSRSYKKIAQGYLKRLRSLLDVREYDVVVIEKELLPYAPALAERLLSLINIPYIVDYDDAIFHNYDCSGNPIIRCLLDQKIDVVMRGADIVVAGNEYLASRAYEAGATNVNIIPTAVNLEKYPYVPPNDEGSFIIGWIGSPTTAQYVKEISSALSEVSDRRDIRVVMVGSGAIEISNVPVEIRDWSEETEVEDISEFDVGIMPLEDTLWERGKCGLKLIQYMACGKPVVASPVGVNTNIIQQGNNGFHAKTKEEWIQSLLKLADNAKLAETMGSRGRERVKKEYSLERTSSRWIELLQQFR